QISVDRSIDLTITNRWYRLNDTQPCPFSTGIGQYRLAIKGQAELGNPKQDHHEHRQQQGEFNRRGPRFGLKLLVQPHDALPRLNTSTDHRCTRHGSSNLFWFLE